MKKGRTLALVGAAALLAASLPAFTPHAQGKSIARDDVYALTASNQLIVFKESSPQNVRARITVSGLAAGESLVGIDFRPATGRLHGISNLGQQYVIDEQTGFTAKLGAPVSPALDGTEFGFDFNPVVDRIRVVSDNAQNLRLHPDTGAVAAVDGKLAYATADPNAGRAPSVTGAAYTNPDNDPNTGTTLYDIDVSTDALVIQNPPNDGVLNTVGKLGVDVSKVVGFDIGQPANANKDGVALAALQPAGGASTLYRIDLATGKADPRGRIGSGEAIRGIAIANDAARYSDLYGLSGANELLGIGRRNPDKVETRVPITGLNAGERLLGIDFRPATGRLYGIGSSSQLYVIDHTTGVAAKVGPVFTTPVNGMEFGVDFNPTVDRIRLVSDAGQNLRIHPETGAVAAVDGGLKFAPGDANAGKTPVVVGAAYTNPDIDPNTATTLFDIDAGLDVLVTQNPPNDGVLNTVGSLGGAQKVFNFDVDALQKFIARFVPNFDIGKFLGLGRPGSGLDAAKVLGFDISSGDRTGVAAIQRTGEQSSRLYEIDLATGRANERGRLAGGELVRGLAVPISSGFGNVR
jgi:uncharacterized protein DUF4394